VYWTEQVVPETGSEHVFGENEPEPLGFDHDTDPVGEAPETDAVHVVGCQTTTTFVPVAEMHEVTVVVVGVGAAHAWPRLPRNKAPNATMSETANQDVLMRSFPLPNISKLSPRVKDVPPNGISSRIPASIVGSFASRSSHVGPIQEPHRARGPESCLASGCDAQPIPRTRPFGARVAAGGMGSLRTTDGSRHGVALPQHGTFLVNDSRRVKGRQARAQGRRARVSALLLPKLAVRGREGGQLAFTACIWQGNPRILRNAVTRWRICNIACWVPALACRSHGNSPRRLLPRQGRRLRKGGRACFLPFSRKPHPGLC
jgi:hypothetical protein